MEAAHGIGSMENNSSRESHAKNQHKKSHRVVFFPLPLQGHINPMFQLANILHTRGFSITIIHTTFNFPDPSRYPHFTFHEIPDGLSATDQVSPQNGVSFLCQLNLNCIDPLKNCLAKLLLESGSEEPIACLITDAIWHSSQAAAEGFNLPMMVLRTSSVCSFITYAAFPHLKARGYLSSQGSHVAEAAVQELPPLKVKDLPLIGTHDEDAFHQLTVHMVTNAKASSGLIWNTFQELEQDELTKIGEEFLIPMFPVGPFHKCCPVSSSSLLEQDMSCLSWLDTQSPNSVLYVSFGSIASITKTEVVEIAWGLANSNQPFLWVIRPGLVAGSDWPELLPDGFVESVGRRGHVVRWAPQQEVLGHPATGGFWTHNGWNSTLESICEGVPMICQPNFGDQMVNARYVSNVWRVGIHLENKLERSVIEKAIRRLMVDTEGQELRERIRHLKGKAELCLEPGGSSHHSLESLISYISSL